MATAPDRLTAPASAPQTLRRWVEQVAHRTRPERVHWCDGSEQEYRELLDRMLASGELLALDAKSFPGCYLHRSHPSDVARVENLTFVCPEREADAGPNNHWMAPAEARRKMDALFEGCMRGRTMYVIPYCMGPIDSPLARCGVEITDSAYVAANMKLMTRMGKAALARIAKDGVFVRGLHSIGELDPKRRFIMHFPESLEIQSFGSGYGGNALLGKKCHALRIASWQARQEGWLAEHMLIVGIENPAGETHYLACAFPSACGKTNLAMLIPPAAMPGWKVWTVGDDIAWLHPNEDGRLWAINPEAGYFGVVPGTNAKTNRHAYEMIRHDTIFTNVGMTADGQPWWEGLDEGQPVTDWQGRPYDPAKGPAAHPNSRFTVAAKQNPSYSPKTDAPEGVPITALVFGGRRRTLAPLVYQARDWAHGVLVGAGMASETTAAATGDVGVVRRDPMAMKPFAGYNFADYWGHWLTMGGRLKNPPGIFHVNWFRRDASGRFLWPGFGDNLRVLAWIIARANGGAAATDTPIGAVPRPDALDLSGLDIAEATIAELLSVDAAAWRAEGAEIARYFDSYGSRLPARLKQEVEELNARLARA
ncbi:MAG TPA: phosphoenolpyruvate carboxykinase (GTP) [Steroidobacteraceae bacterium]|nr:phosphoenolpyruvate carboxykinase (GTP) [Steroidobacteraceae bacterium]